MRVCSFSTHTHTHTEKQKHVHTIIPMNSTLPSVSTSMLRELQYESRTDYTQTYIHQIIDCHNIISDSLERIQVVVFQIHLSWTDSRNLGRT